MSRLRIASFNLESLDDRPDLVPRLEERIAVLQPQLTRLAAGQSSFDPDQRADRAAALAQPDLAPLARQAGAPRHPRSNPACGPGPAARSYPRSRCPNCANY